VWSCPLPSGSRLNDWPLGTRARPA
jgi:hypothetical protein